MITAYDYHVILEMAGLPITGVSVGETVNVNGWQSPPTAQHEAQAAALISAARIAEFSVNAQTVTVTTTPPELNTIDLLINDETAPVALTGGVGTLTLTLPIGGDPRTVKALTPAVFGYKEVTVYAPAN